MAGLRERNKERRRHAILEATLELLRANPLEAVTVEQIAARAEVSPPTIYNLIGTRDQLLLALIDRVTAEFVDALGATGLGEDPIERALHAVDVSVAVFVAEPQAYRQIVRVLANLRMEGQGPAFDALQVHVREMRRARDAGFLRPELDPGALGRQSYYSFVAALMAWGTEDLSDEGFRIAARHGVLTVLAAAIRDEHRETVAAAYAASSRAFGALPIRRL